MSILDDLKKNLNDVAPGLGDKTSALVEKAKNLQQEVVENEGDGGFGTVDIPLACHCHHNDSIVVEHFQQILNSPQAAGNQAVTNCSSPRTLRVLSLRTLSSCAHNCHQNSRKSE